MLHPTAASGRDSSLCPVTAPINLRGTHPRGTAWQFNIESGELVILRDHLEAWRLDISQPLQLDIFADTSSSPRLRSLLCASDHEPAHILIERWRFQYEPLGTRPQDIAWASFYKRFMVLLRGLMAQLRLLPAHRFAASLGRNQQATLEYALSIPGVTSGSSTLHFHSSVQAMQYGFPPPGASPPREPAHSLTKPRP